METRHVVFSHGQESGPWGTKITALAAVAAAKGFATHSVDYRGIDDARARVAKLHADCATLPNAPILCGSSMGAYVTVAAAADLRALAVFLLAPALLLPGLPSLLDTALDCPVTLVQGWRDDVVRYEQTVQFAARHRYSLHVLNSDHRLSDCMPTLCCLFDHFLGTA